MDPAVVRGHVAAITGYASSLDSIADGIARTGWASRSPSAFDLIPGASLVMTAGSVLLAESAAADVRAAVASAWDLIGRVYGDVRQQEYASSADDGSYRLGFLSAADAQAMYKRVLADPGLLEDMTPAQIATFWRYLSVEQSDALVQAAPKIVGNTSGVPLVVRMDANRLTAIDELQSGDLVENEKAYLEAVKRGDIQLVTYDPENHRIVEAINLATWDADGERFVERTSAPDHVITYVPGTLSDMQTFYSGDNYQNFVLGLIGDNDSNHDGENDSVAFVYKDGYFPGEHDTSDRARAIVEASDQRIALDAGVTLAGFHSDVMRDSLLAGSQQTIIGHSWGLADVTASEIAGAHYDQVISLAGAYMPDGWEAAPNTEYSHYSYLDWLALAHEADNLAPDWIVDGVVPDQLLPGGHLVGSGDFPADNPAFDHNLYEAPNNFDVMGNHDLIHDANSPANTKVMDDLRTEIYE